MQAEKPKRRIPSYRFHKPSSRAVVTLNGVDRWLGKYDSPESREKYDRIIAEWLANGRQCTIPVKAEIGIIELVGRFGEHLEQTCRQPDGTLAGEVDNFKWAIRPLVALYGSTPAVTFGLLSLRAVREKMIQMNWSRKHINRQIGRIRFMFQWAVGQELVESSVYQALLAVTGLRKDKTEARESKRIRPVADHLVDPVRDFVSRQVWTMIELQRIAGMRSGEVVIMRACDIDMSDAVWVYRPEHHKTEHLDHERLIYLGSRAQELLRPFIGPVMNKYLFGPAEAEAERLQKLHAKRKTPLSCGNRPGTNQLRRRPAVAPGERYDVASYRRAINRACEQSFPAPAPLAWNPKKETRQQWKARLSPSQQAELKAWRKTHRWHPHQLRHTAGTRFRKQFGLEAANVLLGHTTLQATQLYAEQDIEKAQKVMGLVG